MQRFQEVQDFVRAALECSVFVAPRAPGLTHAEVVEAGTRAAYLAGEIADALRIVTAGTYPQRGRLQAPASPLWDSFHFAQDPDLRNLDAFDFVCREMRDIARAEGAGRAAIARDVLVERARAHGLPEVDVEAAITVFLATGHFVDKDGSIRFAPGREHYPTPREQWEQGDAVRGQPGMIRKTAHSIALPIVKAIVDARTDGRSAQAEALDAFAEQLEKLGYGPFRVWWKNTVAELRRQDTTLAPVSVCVLSAALIEGALTFVVKHGRTLGAFASSDFDRAPRTWKIEDLVRSAASGGPHAVLDDATRHRADAVIKARQRIHAGGMLSDFPAGVPELRPEEARDAKMTAEVSVRRVIDWLQRNPPATS